MPVVDDLNPFSNFNFGWGGVTGTVALFIIGVLILAGIVVLIILWKRKKQYWIKIPLFRVVGNVPTKVKTYKAKVFPIGKAGDRLWYVSKAKKFIAPATLQSAPNEFWHWEREDGEWINFTLGNLDEVMKKAGVKYIHQDMRSQRIATANLLEQRLMKKGFLEKWGVVIGYVIFFLVITVAVVINLYMMGKVIQQMNPLVKMLTEALAESEGGNKGIVPALLPLIMWRFKRK